MIPQDKLYTIPIEKVWKKCSSHSVRALFHRANCTHKPPCWTFHEALASKYERLAIVRKGLEEHLENRKGTDKEGFKVTQVFVIIGEEDDGTEGVWAMNDPKFGWTPMIAADEDRLKSILPVAEQLSKAHGKPYEVRMFLTYLDVTQEMKKKFLPKTESDA